jgi:glutamyl-tRNA reductase
MPLLVLGLSHRTAPADLLDACAVPADLQGKALASVLQREHVREAVVLSTCNRVEVYADVSRFHGGVADLRDHLAEWAGVAPEVVAGAATDHFDTAAAEHLFAVSSGLDSMVVGERQIHAQVRQAFATAMEEGAVGPVLNRVFRQAVRVGRRVRSETAISDGGASIVDLALTTGTAQVATARPAVALVGAGKIGGMAGARLAAAAARVHVVNRSADKATRLADRLAPQVPTAACGIDELEAVLAEVDLVVTSTDAPRPVITVAALREAMARRPDRPLVVVDLAVPRDVEPGAVDVPGVTVVDIQSLRRVVVADGPAADAIAEARAVVAAEARAFAAWSRGVLAGPAIAALHRRGEDVRQAELQRLAGRLASLDPAQREAVDALTRGIVGTLLHAPSVRLKALVDSPDGQRDVRALAHLFDLDLDLDE